MEASVLSAATPEPRRSRDLSRWFFENRHGVLMSLSAGVHLIIIFFAQFQLTGFDLSDEIHEEILFTSVNLSDLQAAVQETAEGEIVATDEVLEERLDSRIAGAVDPFRIQATPPVDLRPDLKPDYTVEARQAGYQGTLYLEVVISEEGRVLQVRPRNRIGYGLERLAVRTFRRKRYRPALKNGEAISVRVIIPVRYTLR